MLKCIYYIYILSMSSFVDFHSNQMMCENLLTKFQKKNTISNVRIHKYNFLFIRDIEQDRKSIEII